MGQKSWLNNNEKNVPSYFCQQQKILAYIKTFYTYNGVLLFKLAISHSGFSVVLFGEPS